MQNNNIVVVKIGSAPLLQTNGLLNLPQLNNLIHQLIQLEQLGYKVVLVSSGAVAAGKSINSHMNKFEDPIQTRQVLSSLGQAKLMELYNSLLKFYGYTAAQVLLTKTDFTTTTNKQNINRALSGLLALANCLVIINENDTTAIEELMFTDNDELTFMVAAMLKAKHMVILTNVEGVYKDSHKKEVIHLLDENTPLDFEMSTHTNSHGRGGIANKIQICRKAAKLGINTFIANANTPHILKRLIHDNENNLGTKII